MPLKEIPDEQRPWGSSVRHLYEWDPCLSFLGKEIAFSDGSRWELLQPFTRLIEEWKSEPPEGRVTCLCKLSNPEESPEGLPSQAVMKIRVQ